MAPKTVIDLLDHVSSRNPSAGITSYPTGDTILARSLRYRHLKVAAESRARQLHAYEGFQPNAVILLHFSDHLENIIWYWAVLHAGCIPALSTPLPNDIDQRKLHLDHLYRLFEDPLCITSADFIDQLASHASLRTVTVDYLAGKGGGTDLHITPPSPEDIAALMLTSGSTGNAKAVCLTHKQILASVVGKSTIANLPTGSAFLNWVGVDHVAALLETHFAALYLGYEQIHVQPADLIASPITFLELLSTHRVSRTFAPNFFLASVIRAVDAHDPTSLPHLDLSALRCVVSGGEANPIRTCEAISRVFAHFGAPEGVLFPAFGMTETCAGSIYHRNFSTFGVPSFEYASLGHCVPGINVRVVPHDPKASVSSTVGRLEVRGPIVFQKYYRNPQATADAFSADGWFDTGDEAIIDSSGAVHVIGRIKDVICINGLKFVPSDIEAGLNDANIPGTVQNYFLCFSYRHPGHDTEQLCVVYLPSYETEDCHARYAAARTIIKKVMLQVGVFPDVLPLDTKALNKSTLGKLSRGKIRTAFINGDLKHYQATNVQAIEQAQHDISRSGAPLSAKADELLEVFRKMLSASLGCDSAMIGPDTPLLEVGMTSIHLIAIKKAIETRLGIELSVAALMKHQTVRLLAAALEAPPTAETYDPVVRLQSNGSNTPLWLFHPGVGEVLVFLGLSAYIEDRPVYALRARGFLPGEPYFSNIEETTQTYYNAIRRHQPHGPYALAGYSYGTMLAFETAKLLQSGDDPQRVEFLGSFNLPPHIKLRMRQMNWTECLLHLGFFLDLVPEAEIDSIRPQVRNVAQPAAVATLLQAASPKRVEELALTSNDLLNWSNLAYALQSMAHDYEPSGLVPAMDVFYCNPLQIVASSKQEWFDQHMSLWKDFCHDVRFHEVEGSHYTMIGPSHVQSFYRQLQQALARRNL